MEFFLNNQVEIILIETKKDGEGNFKDSFKSLGFFFAEVKEIKRRMKVYLNITIRSNPKIKGNFKVMFNGEEYLVVSVITTKNEFLSIRCERRKIE